MRNPEQKMFLSVITQAITDAAYKGYDRYDLYHKDAASAWLTSNSKDFRLICQLADLDPDYAYHKFCLLYTSPSPRDGLLSRMPSSA